MNPDLPNVLLTNDDGIEAPGLLAMLAALSASEVCNVYVVAPHQEQSARSQALTLATPIVAVSSTVCPQAVAAYAVHGTPADSVMVAITSSGVLEGTHMDLVVSGINRGDNVGYHILYSGTVGAAREAACKAVVQGMPAIALSLDNHRASSQRDFAAAAHVCVDVVRAALGLAPGCPRLPTALAGSVINVNVPFLPPGSAGPKGFYLSHMSTTTIMPRFEEEERVRRDTALSTAGLSGVEGAHVLVHRGATYRKAPATRCGGFWAIDAPAQPEVSSDAGRDAPAQPEASSDAEEDFVC